MTVGPTFFSSAAAAGRIWQTNSGSAVVLSNGSRTATITHTDATFDSVYARRSSARTTKTYWEVKVESTTTKRGMQIGVMKQSRYSLGDYPDNPFGEPMYGACNGDYNGMLKGPVTNGSNTGNAAYDFVAGDNLSWAFDPATFKLWLRINGAAWIGGGDPAAGTSPTWTLSSADQDPYASAYGHSAPTTDVFVMTLNGDSSTWTYSAPSGYLEYEL